MPAVSSQPSVAVKRPHEGALPDGSQGRDGVANGDAAADHADAGYFIVRLTPAAKPESLNSWVLPWRRLELRSRPWLPYGAQYVQPSNPNPTRFRATAAANSVTGTMTLARSVERSMANFAAR